MFALAARTVSRPAFSRSLAARAASIHTLPELPYAYNALEPYISEEIMTLHHQKHHQTYVNGLNAAEESYSKGLSVKESIRLQSALKFNGGGHINHSLFWKNLAPANGDGGKLTDGPLKTAIEADFGSLDALKKEFNTKTAAVQGSGWGWLGYNPSTKKLEIATTPNQDPLLTHVPIIGIDIWEHAFYLQYKNVKPDYLAAVWNVVNFKEAEARLVEATQ
ncbi:superoxide dismutase [Mn], mitochondrial [Cylindrobasidium torrendii FP15055 ss-10]|uniref:Superoxide dismutase n=1 Tax=Cylindrobasidium torrendii FP15055 ss-10 TaxID=1314674 RepID=A0A0D7BLA5_9AGAR|nr:superoxide dismutase [Mn], mitochondrial [Cylindrobasidium torrendii FP15055 ss-10]